MIGPPSSPRGRGIAAVAADGGELSERPRSPGGRKSSKGRACAASRGCWRRPTGTAARARGAASAPRLPQGGGRGGVRAAAETAGGGGGWREPAFLGHSASWGPTWSRRASRKWGGIAARSASWSGFATSQRRHNAAASAAAAGPARSARRRPPKSKGDHGAAPETSHSAPPSAGEETPARTASVAGVRSVHAAVEPKRSTSTTQGAGTPTALATKARRRCERASRETPATYTVVRDGIGGTPLPPLVWTATAAAVTA